MVGAEFDDTAPDSVDEGDGGAVRMSANRNLYVRIRDNAGNERGLNIDANGAAAVSGDIANDVADGGNPVKIGGTADGDNPTAVTDGDRVNAWADRHGRIHTRSGHQGAAGNIWSGHHVPAANTQATNSKAAAGVGIRNVVTWLTASIAATATAPTAVNLNINLIDGASGGTTYLWRTTISLPATAGEVRGVALSNLWLPGTANTATTLEFSAAGGANTIESVSFGGVTITE
jgi:hypothetical protein